MKPSSAFSFIKDRCGGFEPSIGMVLGSGSDIFAKQLKNPIRLSYCDIPGFTQCNVAGHEGTLSLGLLDEVPIACLQGRAHYYEGKKAKDIQIPIRVLKMLGCKMLILTNAAASLREEVIPGSLVIINDHINFQFQNPLVGPNDDEFGPRFPSLQQAYDKKLQNLALKSASELSIPINTGVYFATLGPSYETPAEIRAFKLLGADLVGMSTVPEVIVARHCNLKVLAISIISNMACGMDEEFLTHENVLKVANAGSQNLTKLLNHLIPRMNSGQRFES